MCTYYVLILFKVLHGIENKYCICHVLLMGVCNFIREKRLKYIRQSASSLTTHTCVHSGPFPLSYVLLSKCVIFFSSSDPLHMLSLVNTYFFLLDFHLNIALLLKSFLLDFSPEKFKLTLPVLFFYCTHILPSFDLSLLISMYLIWLLILYLPPKLMM